MKKMNLSILALFTLVILLSSCGFPGIVSTSAQLPVVSSTPTTVSLPPIRFPQDEAAHRDLTEWWYYTGHMDAVMPGGKLHHYGFELVFFQALRSDLPPFYAAHFAISDITRGEFHFDQRRQIEAGAVIPNGSSTSGIAVHIGDWSIKGVNGLDHLAASMKDLIPTGNALRASDPSQPPVMQRFATASSQQNPPAHSSGRISSTDYTLHIDLHGLKPPTLHNGNAIITDKLGDFSYYYSRTRMALSGILIDHNQALQVTGEAWMDHQWGNFLTLGGAGWDWFSIQLNDTTEMMLYLIRDATGRTTSAYIDYIGPQSYVLPASALKVTVLDHWRSPVTGTNYPSGWRIEINDPQLQASLTLVPELKDQELVVYQSTGNSYWEGAVSIQGQSAGRSVEGEGYVELTGYTRGLNG